MIGEQSPTRSVIYRFIFGPRKVISTTRCEHGRRRVSSLIFSQNCGYRPSLSRLTFRTYGLAPTSNCERYLASECGRNVGQPEKRVINRRRGRTSFLGRKSLSTANSELSRVTLNYANSQSGKYNRSPDDELLRAVCCRRNDPSYFTSHPISFSLVSTRAVRAIRALSLR